MWMKSRKWLVRDGSKNQNMILQTRENGSESLCIEVREAWRCHVWTMLQGTWVEPYPSEEDAPESWRDVLGWSGVTSGKSDEMGPCRVVISWRSAGVCRDNNWGIISAEVLVEREESLWVHRCNQQKTYDNETGDHTSRQGHYLYKTGRHSCGTKSTEPMNELGVSGHVHRLVKGSQNEKDNEQVIEEDHRIK